MDPREEVRLRSDPVWTERYERERERIEAVSGDQLLFREYLRGNADARHEYEATKREAAATHREDPREYISAKTETVSSLLADAREKGYAERLPSFV